MTNVAILISTYNGDKYLREQLESLLVQEDVKIKIFVRDDGSTDKTIDILNEYQDRKLLTWYSGENLKSAYSFLDLIKNAPEAEYYAFCDQDDIWKQDKMKVAIEELEKNKKINKPLLYCGNYQLVDENLNFLPDNGHVSTTKFSEAIVSSCATGCTIVFNRKLLEVLQKYIPKNIVMHDDWAHKVCLAIGGKVIYDNRKFIYYRQHSNNVDGGVHSLSQKVNGVLKRIRSKECIRSKQLDEIIKGYEEEIDYESLKLIRMVSQYKKTFLSRLEVLFSNDIGTPYKKLNRGFKIAILLGYF